MGQLVCRYGSVIDIEANDAEVRKRYKEGGDVGKFGAEELVAFLKKAGEAAGHTKMKKGQILEKAKAVLAAGK
jgi:hypothetical protein